MALQFQAAPAGETRGILVDATPVLRTKMFGSSPTSRLNGHVRIEVQLGLRRFPTYMCLHVPIAWNAWNDLFAANSEQYGGIAVNSEQYGLPLPDTPPSQSLSLMHAHSGQ